MSDNKYFISGLRYESSLINEKLINKRNNFGQLGVFATSSIKKGEVLAVFVGKVLSESYLKSLPNDLQKYPLQISNDKFLGWDDKSKFDTAEYFNHSCDPNAGIVGSNMLVAIKDIEKEDEVCFDYAMTDTISESWDCCCGTKYCRRKVTGEDWRRIDLQNKYGRHFSEYILEKIENERNHVFLQQTEEI